MTTCTLSAPGFGKTIELSGLLRAAGAALVAISTFLSANAQSLRPQPTMLAAENFTLTGPNDLIVTGGNAETAEYQGRKAVRLTASKEEVLRLSEGYPNSGRNDRGRYRHEADDASRSTDARLHWHRVPGQDRRFALRFVLPSALEFPCR